MLKVRDLMTSPVISVRPWQTLADAEQLFVHGAVHHLPVVGEGGRLVGILSKSDLADASTSNLLLSGSPDGDEMMGYLRVSNAMTPCPETVDVDDDAAGAAAYLLSRDFGCLPVLEDGRMVGIIAETDFVGFLLTRLKEAHQESSELSKDERGLQMESDLCLSLLIDREEEGPDLYN